MTSLPSIDCILNIGKSYTVTGTSSDPGLLPRTLDAIFNSLDPQLHLSDMKILPQRFSEVCYLSDEEMEVEQQRKNHVMKLVRLGIKEILSMYIPN